MDQEAGWVGTSLHLLCPPRCSLPCSPPPALTEGASDTFSQLLPPMLLKNTTDLIFYTYKKCSFSNSPRDMKRRSKLIISCIFFQLGEHSGTHGRAEIGRAESNPKMAPWGAGRRQRGHFGERGVGLGARGSCASCPQSCHLECVGGTQKPPGNPTGVALPRSIPQWRCPR